ncbi:MAG TPA: nuclear transport factor 2 family protein [Tahibacter sp.]|nr:nuclear transport factor 2 family protein [Tahibacter sp.]
MLLNLPKPIANYFRAERGDGKAVARCFAANAVVKDEGNTYHGLPAIKLWQAAPKKKYTYASEPITFEERDGKVIVISRLTGDFPGSPVDLKFFFSLHENRIAALEILA